MTSSTINPDTLPNPLPRTVVASVFLVATTFLATLVGGPAFSWVPWVACGLYALVGVLPLLFASLASAGRPRRFTILAICYLIALFTMTSIAFAGSLARHLSPVSP